jgi:hypothetical protein
MVTAIAYPLTVAGLGLTGYALVVVARAGPGNHDRLAHGMAAATAAGAAITVSQALLGAPAMAGVAAVVTVFMAWVWWRLGGGRRTRRRLRAAGAKARAVLARMAARLRGRPARRQLAPQPG